jgi:predicted MPP superfamily phosphohydrolase
MYFKLSHILHTGTAGSLVLFLLVLFMALSPVLINLYAIRGADRTVKLFAYLGFAWLGFLVLFFPLSVVLDLYNVAVTHGDFLFHRNASSMALSPLSTFLVPCFLSIAVNVYGYFEARNLRVERLTLKTSKLPAGIGRITVAQISDLHLGIILGEKALVRVIRAIEKVKPDVIVSTGDLVDGVVRQIEHIPGILDKLTARVGKFAVTGNHEIYGGTEKTLKFIEDGGFTVLRGRGVTVENMINIAGMDFTGGEARLENLNQKPEHKILSELPQDLFTLLLKHRSDVEEESLGLFDLQLSGHTHKGQIFPMNLATMFLFKYHTGYTGLQKGSAIYVSRGTGTAGPPVRFLSTPEITVFDIMSSQGLV